MVIERDYMTVIYKCGCAGARAVQRPRSADLIYSSELCRNCEQADKRAQARRIATKQDNQGVYYLVDGMKMTVTKDSQGYWRAKRYQDGKTYNKYFGVVDPRPQLEEAQV